MDAQIHFYAGLRTSSCKLPARRRPFLRRTKARWADAPSFSSKQRRKACNSRSPDHGRSLDHAAIFAALPPWRDAPLPEIRRELAFSMGKLVVLHDDHTGTQMVYNVPAATQWDEAELAAEFTDASPCLPILTTHAACLRLKLASSTSNYPMHLVLLLEDARRIVSG